MTAEPVTSVADAVEQPFVDFLNEQLRLAAAELERDRDNAIFAMTLALHSHLPENQRPMSRSDYSDDQWARLTQAYHVVRLAVHEQRTKALARSSEPLALAQPAAPSGVEAMREAAARMAEQVCEMIAINREDRADDTLAAECRCIGEQVAANIRALPIPQPGDAA